jgi:diadenosine tetraphosphatase ApaH/serine/threonine PP2A family protein phosphatase
LLGLLYDVHGNLPALEAVLEDAREVGVGRWIVGGDVALFGAWPVETVSRLRELADAAWLRGNTERWLADDSDRPPLASAAAADCADALGDDTVRDLVELPFDVAEGGALYVHASAASDMLSFFPQPADHDEELLGAVPDGVRRLVFGHTHLPFTRSAGGVELVNPGSVGMPFDGDPRAAWAVVADDGRVEHRRVAYDHDRSAAALPERFAGASWTETVAARIRAARMG